VPSTSKKNSVNLIGEITVRTARFQGQLLTEIRPSTFEQIRELRGMGLVNIVQHGRQRFFLPQESPWIALERVLALYPPRSTSISFLPELQIGTDEVTIQEPVNIPEWLIEPNVGDVQELSSIDIGYFEKCAHVVDELFTM